MIPLSNVKLVWPKDILINKESILHLISQIRVRRTEWYLR